MTMFDTKAPQEAILDLPQERITGDILRGRGPRRGNLERLIKYWRPIMRKPGGFRRCLVILADHPELYPLERICAWLHHETTGLWPNEGNHHEGGKLGPIVGQARRYLKKPKRKKRGKKKKKSDSVYVSPSAYSFRTMVGESRNFGGVLVQPLAGRQNVLEMKAAMFAARHEELQEHRDEIKFKKVGIVGSGSAAGQAVQAVGSFLLPGDISDIRSPIRSQIYETLTPGGGRGLPSARRLVRRGSSGARNKYRCPPGFQKGGTFTNKTYSTCGAQILALPNTGPGSLNADAQRALADLARDASIVRSVGELRSNSNPYAIIRAAQIPFAPKKGSPTRRQISTDLILGRIFDGETFGPRFVRRDGVILEPMVSEEFLRGLDEFDDMVDGSLVTTYDEGILGLDSLRTFGTGLRDNYIAIPDVGVAKISRVGGELSPETREGTIRAFNTSVESRSPDVTAPLMSFIDSSDGKFDLEFGDVVNNRYVKASEEQNELVEVIAGNVRKFVPKWVYNTFLSRSAPRRAKNDPIYEMVADSETKQKSAASFITPDEIDQTRAHSYHIGIDSKAAMFNAALNQADVELKIRLGRAGRAGRGAARAVGDIAGGASAVFDSTLKRYRCPPGTRRGGSFSDKFGSNCGYSLPKNLVNNFISVSQGLKKAMKSRAGVRRAANPEASKKARQGADTQRKNIERVADTLKTTLDKTEDKTSGGIGRTIAQTRKLRTLTPEERVALGGEPLRDALRNLQDFITAEKDNLSVRDTNNLFQALERVSALEAGRITDNPTGDKQIQRDIQNSLQAIVGTMGEIVGTRTRTPERRRRREEARISPDVANVPNLDRLLVDPAEGTRARVRKGRAIPELDRFEFENEDGEIDQAKLDRAVLAIEVTQADLANNLSDMIGRRRRRGRGNERLGQEESLDDLAARTRQFLQENPNNTLVARRYADLEELRELIGTRQTGGDSQFLDLLEGTVRRIAPSRRADVVQAIIGTDTPEARERVTSFTERAARQAQDRGPVTKLRNILDARRARREEARRMQVDRKTKFADVFAPRNKQAESTQAAVLSTLDIEGGVADFANPTWEEIAAIHRAEDQAAMDFFVGNMVSPEDLKLAETPEASHDMLYQMYQKARSGDTTEFRDWARKALSHGVDQPVGAPVEAIDPNTGEKVLVQKTIATNVTTVKRNSRGPESIIAGGRLKFKLKNALTGEVLYEDNGGGEWSAGGLSIAFEIRRDKNMTNVEHGLLGTKHSVQWGGTTFDFNNGGFINQISTQGLPYYRGAGIDRISVRGAASDGKAAWPKKGFREQNTGTIRGLVREMKENVSLYRSLQTKRDAGDTNFTPAEVQAAVLFNDNPEIADRIGNMVDFADRQTDINKVPAHFEFMSALTRRDSKGAKIKDPVVFQYFGNDAIPASDIKEITKRAQEIDPSITEADMRNMRRLGSKYNGGHLDISHLKIRPTQREAADRFDAIESAKEGLRNVYGERVSNTVIGDTNINFIDEVNESGDLVTVSPHLLDLTENERIGLRQGLIKSLAALEAEDSEAFSEQNPAVARLIALSEEFTSPQDGLVNVGSANNIKLITQDLEDLVEDADEIGDIETRDNLTTLLNSIRGAQANENRVFSSEGNPVPVLSELDNFHERVGGRSRERTGRATRSVEGRYNMEGVDGELWEDEDLNDEVLNARLGNLLSDANISEEDWDGMSIQEAAAEFDMSQEEVVDRTIAASHMALVDEIGDDEIDIYGDPVDSGFQVNMTLEDIDLLQSDIDGYLREGRRSRPTDDELRLEKLSAELDNAAADKRPVYMSDPVLQSLKNIEFTKIQQAVQDDRDDFDPVPFISNFDLSQLEDRLFDERDFGKEYIRSTRNFDRDGEMLDINDDASPRYGADAVNAIRDAGPPPQRAMVQVRSDGTREVVPEPVDADPINRTVPNILSSYPANDDFDTFNNRSADFLTNSDATIFSDNELDQVISDLILPDNAANRRSLSPFDADIRKARSSQAEDRPRRASRAFDLSPDARERRDSLDRWSLFEDGSRVEDPKFSTDNNQRVFGRLETEVSDLEILNNPDGDGYIVAGQYLDFDGNSEDLDFSGFYEFESIEEAQDWATGLDILLREAIDGDGDIEDYEDRLDRVLGNELYMGSDSFDPNFGYDSNSGLTGRLDRGREGRASRQDRMSEIMPYADDVREEQEIWDGAYEGRTVTPEVISLAEQYENDRNLLREHIQELDSMRYGDTLHEESDYMAMFGIEDPNMPDYPSWYADPDPDRSTPFERYNDYYVELIQAQGYLDSQADRRNRREGRMSFDPDDMVDNQIDELLLERAIRKEASEDEENMIADMIENQVDAMIEERQGRATRYNENVFAEDRDFSEQRNLDRIYSEAFEANDFEPEALDPEDVEFYMNNQDRLSEDIDDLTRLLRGEFALGESEYATNRGYNDFPYGAGDVDETSDAGSALSSDLRDLIKIQAMVDRDKGRDRDAGLGQRRPGDAGFVDPERRAREGRAAILPPDYPYSLMMMDLQDNLFALQNSPSYIKNRAKEAVARLRNMNRDRRDRRSIGREGRASRAPRENRISELFGLDPNISYSKRVNRIYDEAAERGIELNDSDGRGGSLSISSIIDMYKNDRELFNEHLEELAALADGDMMWEESDWVAMTGFDNPGWGRYEGEPLPDSFDSYSGDYHNYIRVQAYFDAVDDSQKPRMPGDDGFVDSERRAREGRASLYNENVFAEDRDFSEQRNLDRIYSEAFEANDFEPEALDPEDVEFYMNNQDRLSEDIDDLTRLLRGEFALGESEYATNRGYNDFPYGAGDVDETSDAGSALSSDLRDLIKIQAMVDRDKGRDRDAGLGQRRPGDAGFVDPERRAREGRASRERISKLEEEIRQIEDVIENDTFDPEDGGPQWLFDEVTEMDAGYYGSGNLDPGGYYGPGLESLLQDTLRGRREELNRLRGREGRASQSLDDILQRTRRDKEREASRRGNEEFFRLLDTALNEKLRRRRMQDGDREGRASIAMPTRESVEAALTPEEKELLETGGPSSVRNFMDRVTNDGAWGDRAYSLIGPDFENSEYLNNKFEARKESLVSRMTRRGGYGSEEEILDLAERMVAQERAQAKALWEIGRARDAVKQTRNHRAKFDRTDSALMRDVLNVTGVGKQAQDIMGQASAASGPPDSADEMIANLARNVRRRDLRSFGSPRESFLGSRKDIDELIDRLESKKGGLSDDDKSKVDQAIGLLAAVRDSNSGMWRRSPEGNTRFGQVYAGSDPSVWKRLVDANDGLFDADGGLDFSKMSDRDLEQILIDAGSLEDVDWIGPLDAEENARMFGIRTGDWMAGRSPRSEGLFGEPPEWDKAWYMDTVTGDEGGLNEFAKLVENSDLYSRWDVDGFDAPSYDSWVDEIDKELRRRGILQPDESWNDISFSRDFWGNDDDGSSLYKPYSSYSAGRRRALTTAEYEEMKFMQGSRRAREGRASLPGDAARDYNVMVDGRERSAVELAREGDVLDNDYEAVTSMLDRVNEGKLISQRDLDRLSQSRFDRLADELERRDISVNRETRRVGDNSRNQDMVTDALQEVFGDVDDERLEFSNVLENAADVQKDPMYNMNFAVADSLMDLDNWANDNPDASMQDAADYFRSRLGNNFNRYTSGSGLTASQVRENAEIQEDLLNRFFEDYMYDSPFEDLYRRILMPEKGQIVDDDDFNFRADTELSPVQIFSNEMLDFQNYLTSFHEDELTAIDNRFDSIISGDIARERLNEATDLVRTGRMSREGRMARRDVDSLNIDGPPSRRSPLDGPLTGEVDPPFDVRRALDMRERRERGELSRFVDIPTPPPPPRGRDGRYINMMDPDDREMNMALSEVQAPRNTLRERLTSRLPGAQRRARSREAARRRREEETLTRMGLVEPERRSRYADEPTPPPPPAPLVDNDPTPPPPPIDDFIEGRDRRLASYETNAQKRNQRLFEMGLNMEDDNEVVKSVDSARRRRTFSEAFTESSSLKKNRVKKRDWLEDTEWYSDEGPLLPDPVTFSSWVEEENVRDAREGVIPTLQHIGLQGSRDYRIGDARTPLIDPSFKSKVKRDFDYGSYPDQRTLERMSDSEVENYLVTLEWTLSQMEQDDLRKLPITPFSDNPITRSKLVRAVEDTREYLGLRIQGQTDRYGFNPRFRRERRQSGKEPYQEFFGSMMANVWENDRRIRGGGRRERDARDLTSRERAEGWNMPSSMGGEPDRESPEYRSRAGRNVPGEGATSARGGMGFAPVRRQPDREGRASRMREGRAAVPSDDLVRRAERRERPLERNYSREGSPRYQQEEIAELEEVLAGRKRLEEIDDRYSRGFKNFVSYWQDNREADMAEEARFDREDFDYEAFRDSDVLPVQGLLERYLDTLYEDLQSDISSMRRRRNQRGINERTPVTIENRETGERRQGFYGSNIDQERAINEIIENRIGPKRDNESRTDYQERKLTALDQLIASESGGGSETVMLGDGPSINYFDSYMDFTDEEYELFRNRIEPFREGERSIYGQPDTPSMEGAAYRLRNAIEGQVRFREGRFSRNVERDRGREDLRAPRRRQGRMTRRDDLPPDEAAAPRIPREIRDPETGEMVRNPEFNELYEDRLRRRRRRAEGRQAERARRAERRERREAEGARETRAARERRARRFNESMDASDRRMADAERRRRESLGLEGQALQEERIENEQRDLEKLNEIREEAQLRDMSREGRASLRERISDEMFERVDPFDDYERYEDYLREMYARYSEGQSFERIAEAAKTTPADIESDIKWDIFGLYSDLYKSEHGIRPTWLKWQEMSIEDLENLLDTEYPSVPMGE